VSLDESLSWVKIAGILLTTGGGALLSLEEISLIKTRRRDAVARTGAIIARVDDTASWFE